MLKSVMLPVVHGTAGECSGAAFQKSPQSQPCRKDAFKKKKKAS